MAWGFSLQTEKDTRSDSSDDTLSSSSTHDNENGTAKPLKKD